MNKFHFIYFNLSREGNHNLIHFLIHCYIFKWNPLQYLIFNFAIVRFNGMEEKSIIIIMINVQQYLVFETNSKEV